jgi:DNA-binding protein HU-beta
VNKSELIDALADKLGTGKKEAQTAVDAVLDTITRAVVAGEKVAITGFGIFEKVERGARTARNPRTGATVKVKKTSVAKFRPGAELKAFVSGAKKLAKQAPAKAASTAARATAPVTRTASAAAKKATASKSTARKAPAKTTARKTTTKATTAKKAPARKTAARTTTAARKTTARKTTAKKTTTRKTAAKKA